MSYLFNKCSSLKSLPDILYFKKPWIHLVLDFCLFLYKKAFFQHIDIDYL